MLFSTLAVLSLIPVSVLGGPVARHHAIIKRRALPLAVEEPVLVAPEAVLPSPRRLSKRCKTRSTALPPKATATPSPGNAAVNVTLPADDSTSSDSGSSTKSSTKTSTDSESTSTKKESTPTSTASTPKPTKITGSTGVINSLFSALLPGGQGSKLWSTATDIVDSAVKLSMDAFNANSVSSSAPAIFENAPDGSPALGVHFKKGSWTFDGPSPSGLTFYASPLDLSSAKEVVTSYQIYFPTGFDFVKGGKLPGLYGGTSPAAAKSCSGGRRATDCFSVRFMWRTDGAGELYTYLPDPSFGSAFKGNKNLCTAVPNSDCNSVYGASVGRGSFKFETGAWTTIAQRVRLNDAGASNGELELIVNGDSKFTVTGLRFTDEDASPVGLQMQSFFGGHDSSWASPSNQALHMKNFNMAVTATK